MSCAVLELTHLWRWKLVDIEKQQKTINWATTIKEAIMCVNFGIQVKMNNAITWFGFMMYQTRSRKQTSQFTSWSLSNPQLWQWTLGRGWMRFFRRVGLSLGNWISGGHLYYHQKKWLQVACVSRSGRPPDVYLRAFWTCPTGRWLHGRPRTCLRDFTYHLTWKQTTMAPHGKVMGKEMSL